MRWGLAFCGDWGGVLLGLWAGSVGLAMCYRCVMVFGFCFFVVGPRRDRGMGFDSGTRLSDSLRRSVLWGEV